MSNTVTTAKSSKKSATKTSKKTTAKSTAHIRYGMPLSELEVGDRIRAMGINIHDTGESAFLIEREVEIIGGTDSPSLEIGDGTENIDTEILRATMSPKKQYHKAKIINPSQFEKRDVDYFLVALVLGPAGKPVKTPPKVLERQRTSMDQMLRLWFGIPVIGLIPTSVFMLDHNVDNDLVAYITEDNKVALALITPAVYLTHPSRVSVITTTEFVDSGRIRDSGRQLAYLRKEARNETES